VGVQALEAAAAGRPSDSAGNVRPEVLLVRVRPFEAHLQLRVFMRPTAPALDPTRGLEPRDRRDEVPARDPERGRERLAGLVMRPLLRHGRPRVGAAHRDAPERSRGTA
jgi:hypothetical protein